MIDRWLNWLAYAGLAGLTILMLDSFRTLFASLWKAYVCNGTCVGCGKRACPMVGGWRARRRRFAYCPDCMPELYTDG